MLQIKELQVAGYRFQVSGFRIPDSLTCNLKPETGFYSILPLEGLVK
jgi:hypothetical protein